LVLQTVHYWDDRSAALLVLQKAYYSDDRSAAL
jgi:hypothetical protein